MRQIVEEQAAQGRKVIFVSGAMEIVENGEIIEARGVISVDGKTMWIQADDATVAPEQIALHEEFHAKVKADPSLISRMKAKVKEKYKGKLELLTEVYANLYFTDDNGHRTVSDDYIIEEILADAYAGIDVLETVSEAEVRATEFSEDIREGAKSIESTRAPPSNGDVRASRKPQRGRSQEIETMENNRFERLRRYRDDLPSEWFAYTRDYYYIYSNQSFMDYTILLKVKITDRNKVEIDNFTKEIENGIDGSTKAFDSWTAHFRRGKGRYSWNSISSPRSGAVERVNGMDGQRIQRSPGESAWEYNGSNTKEGSRNSDKVIQNNEAEDVLSSLKDQYGVDDSGIKASRSMMFQTEYIIQDLIYMFPKHQKLF